VYTHLPVYERGTECSETSAYKIQAPENHPKESIQQVISYPSVTVTLSCGGTDRRSRVFS